MAIFAMVAVFTSNIKLLTKFFKLGNTKLVHFDVHIATTTFKIWVQRNPTLLKVLAEIYKALIKDKVWLLLRACVLTRAKTFVLSRRVRS